MNIHFKIVNDGQVFQYQIERLKTHGRVFFNDPIYDNTSVEIITNSDSVEIQRRGQVTMNQRFVLNTPTVGELIDSFGVRFELRIFTTKLWIFPSVIQIDYVLQINDDDPISQQIETFFPD